jgi:hypothetical protein
MPVERMHRRESPCYAINGNSFPDMVILCNIFRVIEGDKAIIRNLPENCKGNYCQKKAYE